jgi:hypothetical protein
LDIKRGVVSPVEFPSSVNLLRNAARATAVTLSNFDEDGPAAPLEEGEGDVSSETEERGFEMLLFNNADG